MSIRALATITPAARPSVIVMISEPGNFVSRINLAEGVQESEWPGTLATSIVGISPIYLPRVFMKLDEISNRNMLRQALAHLAFVVSALSMPVMAQAAFASDRH